MSEIHPAVRRRPLLVLLGVLLADAPVAATDWPHWRGPTHDGVADGGGAFEGPFSLELAWVRPLGVGYSGISVADGRAVTTYSDGKLDYVVALDAATGSTLWNQAIDPAIPADGTTAGIVKSVPAIDAGVVYVLGPQGHLLALKLADGSRLWRLHVGDQLGAAKPPFGFATSPLVAGELLLVQAGGPSRRSLTALNKRTGEVVWSTGDDPPEYQSPIPATLAGVDQILSVTQTIVRGLDPTTGTVLWSRHYDTSIVPTPVLLGDDRFLLPGDERSLAFRVRRGDGGFEVEPLWVTTALKGNYSTPVLHEGFLYGFSGEVLACVSAADGKRIWASRPPGGHGLILLDRHLVILGNGGKIVVAEASPTGYRETATIDVLDRTSYTYPSFADGRIFVRNVHDIAAVRVARTGATAGRAAKLREAARSVRVRFWSTLHGIEDRLWSEVRRRLGPPRDGDDTGDLARLEAARRSWSDETHAMWPALDSAADSYVEAETKLREHAARTSTRSAAPTTDVESELARVLVPRLIGLATYQPSATSTAEELAAAERALDAEAQRIARQLDPGEARERLAAAERAWTRYRDASIALFVAQASARHGTDAVSRDVALVLTHERIDTLRAVFPLAGASSAPH